MFWDVACPLCGRSSGSPCDACVAAMPLPPILAPPDQLERCHAIVGYHGTGRELVTHFKFRNQRCVVPWVAERMAEAIRDEAIDVVTWAPTSQGHRRRRGFDQAEVCARRLARSLEVPAVNLLVRLPGPPQTGRHREERLRGPGFDSRRGILRHVGGKRVALVDDVVTTGATMTGAGRVLVSAGARAVVGVAIARTPRGGRAVDRIGDPSH